jgi:hypothetical protein
MRPVAYPLPFIYESTGTETRFTNGYDPEAQPAGIYLPPAGNLAELARRINDDDTSTHADVIHPLNRHSPRA